MNEQTLWERFCQYYLYFEEVGIGLDVSRMRFDESFLKSMEPSLNRALASMGALESGAIANPDEGRMVGHYWLRTPELAPTKEIAQQIQTTLKDVLHFSSDIRSGKVSAPNGESFRHVLLVGIGGSALGPQLMSDALVPPGEQMQLHFCDNTDPDGIARIVMQLGSELARTLVLVVSKSGGTVETRNGADEIAACFQAAKLTFASHAVAVTCQGSKLDQKAQSGRWLKRFPMWDWVGGRTSIFSAVGLLPAALVGINIEEFVRGGAAMDALTREANYRKNPAALLALMWHFAGDGRGKKDMVVLPYKDRLVLFSKYLQQLVMESLGKEHDLAGNTVHQGIAVYGNKGSTDQHAYVQQLRDGLNNFFATLIEVQEDYCFPGAPVPYLDVEKDITSGDYLTGFLFGTRKALFENKRDSITVTLRTLNPYSLGAVIALYERAVGLYAFVVNINAYHQPGVEAGKVAAQDFIALQKQVTEFFTKNRNEWFTATHVSQSLKAETQVENIYHILEHLAANAARGLQSQGTKPDKKQFKRPS